MLREVDLSMFDKDTILQARSTDLLEYLQTNGYQIKRKSRNEYCLVEHDSLIISNNKWHWKSRDIGGNTLDFLVKYENKSFAEAVAILTHKSLNTSYNMSSEVKPTYSHFRETIVSTENKQLTLPEKAKGYSRLFAYLCKTRGIDSSIVDELVKKKKIYESVQHNCVFLGQDKQGNIKYACQRGTLSYKKFRGECSGSDKQYGFIMEGKSNKAYVFEAPIEAMSHATLYKLTGKDYTTDYRLSLGGVEPVALIKLLEENKNINHVVLSLNNDAAGKAAMKKIHELLKDKYPEHTVKFQLPRSKDFNDDLVMLVKERTLFEVR